jgi:opacity protein-like surface antigen
MMRNWIAVAGTLALAMTSGAVVAQDRGFYWGFDLGQGSVNTNTRGLDQSLIDGFAQAGLTVVDGSSSVSEDGFSWGLTLGYQVIGYLAVEASYIDLGGFEYRARGTATDGIGLVDGRVAIDGRGRGPALSALGMLPLGNWVPYLRAGVVFADADYDVDVTIGGNSASDEISGSSENFLWGVGVGYRADQWTTRLEYQQAQDVGENNILGKADVSRIVLGAIYRF